MFRSLPLILMLLCASCAEEVALKPLDDKAAAEVRAYIDLAVAGGFRTQDEIVESVPEIFGAEYDAAKLQRLAAEHTAQSFETHRREQERWPAVTDCDRLDRAFAELESAGVICRQDFSCCGTCGSAEIWDEMKLARDAGRTVRGYAFYHMQDTEAAVEGHGLCLNYGSVEEGQQPALDVAALIVAALERNGLKVEWDGTWEKRIEVPMDWKRRRK